MTAKCANPLCSVPFHRLGHGRLFRFEVRPSSEPCRDVPITVCRTKSGRASVYFWLCGKCRLTKTLKFDRTRGLTIEPIPQDGNYLSVPENFEVAQRGEQVM